MFARPARAGRPAAEERPAVDAMDVTETSAAKRPPKWSMRHWPVRWKVFAIALFPLVLAILFGGLRIYSAVSEAGHLRLAAGRADVVPAITKYMSALDVALVANSTGADVEGAQKNYQARTYELQARLADTDVAPDVRTGVSTLLNGGRALVDQVTSNRIGLRDRVTAYAPILLTAENAVNGSVRVDSEKIRAEAEGLSRALGARGQMLMQRLLVTRGGDLPEPDLRTSMITLAGTEPSTLFGMSEILGVGSQDAKTLQQQMVARMAILSDPAASLVNNPALLRSIQTTDEVAGQVINHTNASVTKSVHDLAASRREGAIRDTALIVAAIAAALIIVFLVARSLVQPLRVLRDGALKVAHEDLEREIARVRAGDERPPDPVPVYTTEEIGQVAHAVDELHTQALLLAGDEARLRLLVNDMFETMSRRNRSLVDQQISLIDRLERNEEDPDRLDSLFRLDHLAARMRRNGANLLVLSGAQLSGGQRGPVPLSTVIDAARSEVEDYRRVETVDMLDVAVTGAASGDIIHLLAELIDNALRYSPPSASVRVSAVRPGTAGVLVQITDSGLGMTDGNRRIANMRLRAGGEVSPENARHMGLFVVGRLADRHGMRVRLRGAATDEPNSGTTAEIFLPPSLLAGEGDTALQVAAEAAGPAMSEATPDRRGYADAADDADAVVGSERNGAAAGPAALLPRRSPGTSGITGRQPEAEAAPVQSAAHAVSDTSAYFSSRSQVSGDDAGRSAARGGAGPSDIARLNAADTSALETSAEFGESPPASADDDLIYQRMLSEWLIDPREVAHSADLDWKSVWDRGWSAAAEVENVPIASHTDQGLPVRDPGARLVPGTAAAEEPAPANGAASPTWHSAADDTTGLGSRDPDAIRASISSHFGGVRAARSQARDSTQGPDSQ